MLGLMQERPLLISSLIEHAARNHGDTEVISRLPGGETVRLDYATIASRAKRLAAALQRLGLEPSARVGTLAWNTHRHLELYFGVSGCGLICHTINPRLFYEQIAFIVNHADDKILFVELDFLALASRLAKDCPGIRHWVLLCRREQMPATTDLPGAVAYEDFTGGPADDFEWPGLDENTASNLCYTSGTTGHPKGVLYSHRSTVLHTYATALPDAFGLSACDCAMPASSMYHANGWGIPYVAAMVGAKLVLPGSKLDGESLHDLLEAEGVTISAGVPTIWLGLTQYLESSGKRLTSLRRLIIGGAACPVALMEEFREKYAVKVQHLWGMTETSPLGTSNSLKFKYAAGGGTPRQLERIQRAQGRTMYGIEMKIVDDDGRELPRDGVAFGDLKVRGGWVTERYFKSEQSALDSAGWFATGDVSTICPDGYMCITDRSKDVIKSGGEWISSIDLENAAMGHPSVAEAAVIGIPNEKWSERPLLILVLKPSRQLEREDMLTYLAGKVAKWWLPDDVVFVGEIPHTATGKILKTALREQFKNHRPLNNPLT
jgi:3-(methylthio)propionyl---CoA ligase